MCEYCNGDKEEQEPLVDDVTNEVDSPILTILSDLKKLSVSQIGSVCIENTFRINYCPMCGRKL